MIIRSIDQKKQRLNLDRNYNVHRIANQLRRYFLPASTFPAPGSTAGQSGNRNTASTASIQASTSLVTTQAVQLGAGGLAAVRFPYNFQNPPNVACTAVGASQSGNPGGDEITVVGFPSARRSGGVSGCIIQSTYASDNRWVYVHVVGTPN